MYVQTIYLQALYLYTVHLHFTGFLVRFPELSGELEVWLIFVSLTKYLWGLATLYTLQ